MRFVLFLIDPPGQNDPRLLKSSNAAYFITKTTYYQSEKHDTTPADMHYDQHASKRPNKKETGPDDRARP
jgi:hypothetical protein